LAVSARKIGVPTEIRLRDDAARAVVAHRPIKSRICPVESGQSSNA